MDRSGLLWIGHEGAGLSQLFTLSRGVEILPIPFQPTFGNNFPKYKRITEDSQGLLWVATFGNGLYKYDPKTGKTDYYPHEENNPRGLADNLVWDVLEDQQGRIWVGTHSGLQLLDQETNSFVTYKKSSGLRHEASAWALISLRASECGTTNTGE